MATGTASNVWTDEKAVTGRLAIKAMEYIDISDRTIAMAKESGFDDEGWNELGALLDTTKFQRMSKDREPICWENYRPILTNWASKFEFRYKFKRVIEAGNIVCLELEEHTNRPGEEVAIEHTASMFEFDSTGKIVAFSVYFMVH